MLQFFLRQRLQHLLAFVDQLLLGDDFRAPFDTAPALGIIAFRSVKSGLNEVGYWASRSSCCPCLALSIRSSSSASAV
ncbi:hypothetical protein WJ976_04995 [Achromobacter denitrificans]